MAHSSHAGGVSFAVLATASVALNYGTRSLVPIVSHSVCEGANCTASTLVSESTSAFFVGDLVAQFTAGVLVKYVTGPWLLALSTMGWALATLLIPVALQPSSPHAAHSVLQWARGVLCGFGFPGAHAVVAATPVEVRGTVLGLVNSSAGIGSMLANLIVPRLLTHHSWELPFQIIAVMSITVAMLLALLGARARLGLFINSISSEANGNVTTVTTKSSAGSDYLQWLQEPLVRGLVIWMVVAAVGVQTVGGAYLPTLFIERHGVNVADIGVYTGAPPLAQVIVCLSVGLLCDALVNKLGLPAQYVQARLQLLATAVPALSLLLLSQLENSPCTASVLVTMWLGTTSFQSAGAMAVLHAVGGRRAGELFVLGNAFAKLGALMSTSATRWALQALGWPAVLAGLAAAYSTAGAVLLPRMRHVERAAAFVATDKGYGGKED